MDGPATVLVAGGGIGGLTAALVREVRNISDSGSVIFRMPVHRYAWPGSRPGVTISRGDLVGLLLAAAERAGVDVRRGHYHEWHERWGDGPVTPRTGHPTEALQVRSDCDCAAGPLDQI